MVKGEKLESSISLALEYSKNYKGHEECLEIVKYAIRLSEKEMEDIIAIKLSGEDG